MNTSAQYRKLSLLTGFIKGRSKLFTKRASAQVSGKSSLRRGVSSTSPVIGSALFPGKGSPLRPRREKHSGLPDCTSIEKIRSSTAYKERSFHGYAIRRISNRRKRTKGGGGTFLNVSGRRKNRGMPGQESLRGPKRLIILYLE